MYVHMRKGGQDGHFWEVLVIARQLHARSGRVGTDGRAYKTRVLRDWDEACAHAHKRIERKRKDGYRESSIVVGEQARNHELEAAIMDAPDQLSGYLVYADWLQAQGDPRGELIMLDYRLEQKKHNARLIRDLGAFRRKHGARLLPDNLRDTLRRQQPDTPRSNRCDIERQNGFVHSAFLGRGWYSSEHTVRELLLALLFHPSAALLQDLTIRELGQQSRNERQIFDYRPIVAALTQSAPPSLRRLHLADTDSLEVDLANCLLGEVGELLSRLPRLQEAHLRGGDLTLDGIQSQSLQKLTLETPEPSPRLLQGLDGAIWPNLRELTIDCADQALDTMALPTLLSGRATPKLRALALPHTRSTGRLLRTLVTSPLMDGLRALDLSYGDLGDADVAAITDNPDGFRSLEHLVLDGNMITRQRRADIFELCQHASIQSQRGMASDRPHYEWNDIVEFSPDFRSVMAARDVADVESWVRLGTWANIVWGMYQGSDLYDVSVAIASHDDMRAKCTCPSYKYPCKHALGLLMLATEKHLVPVARPPDWALR